MQFIRVAYRLARFLPLRRRVVFALTHANHLSGNLAFIRDELDRRTPPIPYVTLANRYDQTWRAWFGLFLQNIKAGYHLATARVFIVDDYYFPLYVVPRRPGTTSVQTWHASGAFKKIGWSVLDKSFGADESLVARVTIHSNYDVCLMASKGAAMHYAEAFRQPLEKFRTDIGMPRTDVLFGEAATARIRAEVRARYRLPEGKRVILYAPTFRGDNVRHATSPTDLDLELLHRELGSDHILLLKLHPFVRDAHPIPPALREFAIDASDHPDIHELMLVSDVLLTDYSSAIFEFSLLTRPMVFYIPDLASYEGERGFYIKVPEDLPGPVFETTAELAAFVRAGSYDIDRVARFRDDSFEVADGHASERFVDRIVIPALRGSERA
ncbi:MAG TPA: CDP-glycerol glycerophosphotransferase family protein [Candidatus Limnocylindria bacterium]|nr:CDP-glycerol glycerophosphotransferase family protein [Candidatus Limnocylindria bacterium]